MEIASDFPLTTNGASFTSEENSSFAVGADASWAITLATSSPPATRCPSQRASRKRGGLGRLTTGVGDVNRRAERRMLAAVTHRKPSQGYTHFREVGPRAAARGRHRGPASRNRRNAQREPGSQQATP